MTAPTHLTFRDSIRKISPPWLARGRAEKILYAFAVHLDALGDALVAGVKIRFPGLYSDESLSLLSRERRIMRGLLETPASFAARLERWLTDHRMRGGPYAMLGQLFAYYAPSVPPMDLIYASGRRFQLASDGTITRDDIAWSPDTSAEQWARWWLIVHTDQFASTPPTPGELEELRHVPAQWNAAHAQGHIIVLASDAELWNYPVDRTWNESGTWNTAGTYNITV